MFTNASRRNRTRLILAVVILVTIPCYCLGVIVMQLAPVHNAPTETPTPSQTLSPTSTPSATPTTTLHPDRDPNLHQHLDTDTHRHHHPDGHPHQHEHSDRYANRTAADPDAHTHLHANTHPFGYPAPVRNSFSNPPLS